MLQFSKLFGFEYKMFSWQDLATGKIILEIFCFDLQR